MYYFGLLFEMNLKLIKLRLEFLKEFLNLPNTNQLCETLRFVYAYLCIYVCVRAYIHICIYVCMYACMYVCMYVCTYMSMSVHVFVQ